MRKLLPPGIDARRTRDFSAELRERARSWIPAWAFADEEGDFGLALLEIAARFNSEVAERLDGAGEKMRRGFLDWLGIRAEAARPARVPVVFKLADASREAVEASPPVRMQADADGTTVVFEADAETGLRLIPGKLDTIVAVDADNDAYYLPPPGLSDLQPADQLPTEWKMKTFAARGASKIQLDPDAGLSVDTVIETDGGDSPAERRQYRITGVDNGIVTIDPPLDLLLDENATLRKLTTFTPFDGFTRNRQLHALYLGHPDLLNIEAAATIEVVGAGKLRSDVQWQYWGTREKQTDWHDLTISAKQNSSELVLEKSKGTIELRDVGAVNSRWIRAVRGSIEKPESMFQADALYLKVNASDPICPNPAAEGTPSEAMAGTTPLVVSKPFYPLGRVPRQFDAFYLGSKEAFSKKEAKVNLCFELADATSIEYIAVPSATTSTGQVLLGIGADKALHIFKLNLSNGSMTRFRGPLRPVRTTASSGGSLTVPVELNEKCLPVTWPDPHDANKFNLAVASGGEIWVLKVDPTDDKAEINWVGVPHSIVGETAGQPADIESIVILKKNLQAPGAVLSNNRVYLLDAATTWVPLKNADGGPNVTDFAVIAPIYDKDFNATDSILGVPLRSAGIVRLQDSRDSESIHRTVELDIGENTGTGNGRPAIRPFAFEHETKKITVIAVDRERRELIEVKKNLQSTADPTTKRVEFEPGMTAIGRSVVKTDPLAGNQFFVSIKNSDETFSIASWLPAWPENTPASLFYSEVNGAVGKIGSPLISGSLIVVPGGKGDSFVATFDPTGRLDYDRPILEGLIVANSLAPSFKTGDWLSAIIAGAGQKRKEWEITKEPQTLGAETIYLAGLKEKLSAEPNLTGYSDTHKGTGSVIDRETFDLLIADPRIEIGDFLRIEVVNKGDVFCRVKGFGLNGTRVILYASTKLPKGSAAHDALAYWIPQRLQALVRPAIEFARTGDGDWDREILDRAWLYFASPIKPHMQRAVAFGNLNKPPAIVALTRPWMAFPFIAGSSTPFILDSGVGRWRQELADTTANPELSWEYWNGKGWWSLEKFEDGTRRLFNSGEVTFEVPTDIEESDWAGKTNFWIRARLVGGDYGQEDVIVTETPLSVDSSDTAGSTKKRQSYQRNADNVRAPLALGLKVFYANCKETLPVHVFAEDSGVMRDQSDANRTPTAIVEAFIPIARTLGRLSRVEIDTERANTKPEKPPSCEPEPVEVDEPNCDEKAEVKLDRGRSLFVGLDASVSAGAANVLMLAAKDTYRSRTNSLEAYTITGGKFELVSAEDATRALDESGVITMSFAEAPTLSDLFGRTLTWVRLVPAEDDGWEPSVRGAYLNGVFATAKETLTRERLGSSDGSPNLMLRLARPPVLRGTLELRVREPLGEEERADLLQKEANSVLTDVDDLTGDWVLWKQVGDPLDEGATERVYSLDETTGEVTFGDGKHGRIPPIGRDSIVAFTYARTEATAANSVKPRTPLNLVSPVESVESVTAADSSAGGAPPEPDERVLRFGFSRVRHRGRAVTAADLEDLAMQSSPDIAQAKAVPSAGRVRLVIAMNGANPAPTAAQVRELRRLLLSVSSPAINAPGVLQIEAPSIRRLRLNLILDIEDLDHAAYVTRWVNREIARFFDVSSGGTDRHGWKLGQNPHADDIAFAIAEAPRLESIVDVRLLERLSDGNDVPWTKSVRPTDLVVLGDNPVKIEFERLEVAA